MTGQDALRRASARLRAAGIPSPERDARWIFAAITGVPRDRVTLRLAEPVEEELAVLFFDAVKAREGRTPMSHILGGREFYGRWFRVTPDVLDPRPETEVLIEAALAAPYTRVLDLGTGSGCILVTLLAERPEAKGVGTDVSAEAALIAGENAAAHGVADRIVLPLSEWWDDVGGLYDLIVTNPPYVAASEMSGLAPELHQEPRLALTDDGDGLGAYRAIAPGLLSHLAPGGRVLLEIGWQQADQVTEILRKAGFRTIDIIQDLDGRDRVLQARHPHMA